MTSATLSLLLLYAVPVFPTLAWAYLELRDSAWPAPRWVVFVVSVLAGVFWWVVGLARLVAWMRRRR